MWLIKTEVMQRFQVKLEPEYGMVMQQPAIMAWRKQDPTENHFATTRLCEYILPKNWKGMSVHWSITLMTQKLLQCNCKHGFKMYNLQIAQISLYVIIQKFILSLVRISQKCYRHAAQAT